MDIMDKYLIMTEERAKAYASELGSYNALLNYAIMALKGETTTPNEQVAKYLILQRNRINERIDSIMLPKQNENI